MTVVAAKPILSATQRNLLWGFIALLAALAFLRSIAPENTANAVRKLIKSRGISSQAEKEELEKLRDEIHRERVALERLQNETGDSRAFLERFEEFHNAEDERGVVAADQIVIPTPEYASNAISDESSPVEEREQGNGDNHGSDLQQNEQSEEAVDADDSSDVNEGKEEEYAMQLADGECPSIIALQSSISGLGTQIEDFLSLLSLSFAVQNACVVLPPINSYDDEKNFRPVAFGEVYDEEEFSKTGVRTVPLSVCKDIGVSDVFDDGGAETAIVKNFAAFVRDSNPDLARETTLVHKETSGHRFQNSSAIGADVTIMAKYIYEKVGRHNERTCIGFGRMRAAVAINLDILEHLKPTSSIAEFLASRYPLANETMFVKLRWNKSHCEHKRTETGTVCVVSDIILSTEEYIRSIAHTAQQMGVSFIYLSLPSHVPDDVSEEIYTNLKIQEPILLGVGGDIFTANIIEHELAIQAKVFIPDGGAWSETVQMLRSSRNRIHFRDDIDSSRMVQEWKDAGWPRDSPFLITQSESIETHTDSSEHTSNDEQDSKVTYNGEKSAEVDSIPQQQKTNSNGQPPNVESTHLFPNQQDDSDDAVHVSDTEHRPAQYEPPGDYVPNEDTDDHIFPNPGNDEAQASQYSDAQQLSTGEQQPLVENQLLAEEAGPAEEAGLAEEAGPAEEVGPAEEAGPAEDLAPAEEASPMDEGFGSEDGSTFKAAAEDRISVEEASLNDHQLLSEHQSHSEGQLSPEQASEVEYQTRMGENILPEQVAVTEAQKTGFETGSVDEHQPPDERAAVAEHWVGAEEYSETGK